MEYLLQLSEFMKALLVLLIWQLQKEIYLDMELMIEILLTVLIILAHIQEV